MCLSGTTQFLFILVSLSCLRSASPACNWQFNPKYRIVHLYKGENETQTVFIGRFDPDRLCRDHQLHPPQTAQAEMSMQEDPVSEAEEIQYTEAGGKIL